MQSTSVKLLTTKIDVKEYVKNAKADGKTVGFVPTMGALHEGHESLITCAIQDTDEVIVSIFVNPTQFGPNEDFDKYPRQLEKDIARCEKLGVKAIFAPTPEETYSDKNNLTLVLPSEKLKNKMCGKTRAGHFDGVATVVLKLFNIVQPDAAYFGQKDAQQLFIINKMVKDLDIPVNIVGCPIVRDENGLALSSRNAYLSENAKIKALTISKTLINIQNYYVGGKLMDIDTVMAIAKDTLDSLITLEYLEIYDYNTLLPVTTVGADTLVAIAVKIDGIRLIDNILI